MASFQPMGRMFARVNSKCPTALTPAFSNSCAQAFRPTPARIQIREIGFIVLDGQFGYGGGPGAGPGGPGWRFAADFASPLARHWPQHWPGACRTIATRRAARA
ncbi:hypothetical protein PSP6_160194 [Paraburkholderia tropica]|nr:hypothetical protein PSP6_160194 [Paraburkholderia tropica]